MVNKTSGIGSEHTTERDRHHQTDQIQTWIEELSIIIPAWNEARRITLTLDEIKHVMVNEQIEIIVVDDGSTDNTYSVVKFWAEKNPHCHLTLIKGDHKGKGGAIKKGILNSRGMYVAYIDADLDIHPKELKKLFTIAKMYKHDVVIGSKKMLSFKHAGVNLQRRILSKGLYLMNNFILNLPVTDTQTGCKLFNGNWVREIISNVETEGFLFDIELINYAVKDQLSIEEVPIEVNRSTEKENQIKASDAIRLLSEYVQVISKVKQHRKPGALTARTTPELYSKVQHMVEEFAEEFNVLQAQERKMNVVNEEFGQEFGYIIPTKSQGSFEMNIAKSLVIPLIALERTDDPQKKALLEKQIESSFQIMSEKIDGLVEKQQ